MLQRLREAKAIEPLLRLLLPHLGSRHLLHARLEWPDNRSSPISRRPHSESNLRASRDCPCALDAGSLRVRSLELPADDERLPIRVDMVSMRFRIAAGRASTPYPRIVRYDPPTGLAHERHR